MGNTEDARTDSQTRRAFCANACQAVSLLTMAGLIQACGGGPTSPSDVPSLQTVTGTPVAGGVTVAAGSSSPLASVGSAVLVQSSVGDFLVSKSSSVAFVALSAICTHQTCTVSGFQNQTYVCPCHGSQFNLNGGVVQGPAAASLRQFATTFAGDVLTIHT